MITFANSLQIVNIFALSALLILFWSMPSDADLSATNSRVSELELRQTNNLAYLEERHNDLAARVTDRLNGVERRVQMLEVKAGR